MNESKDFYNKFDKKLIQDYLKSNRRIESAIKGLSSFIPVTSEKILDIGCGLGWSSHEFALQFEGAEIEGLDLSPVLIKSAKKLFSRSNLNFQALDITRSNITGSYDAVILIDVYEHIPKNERDDFHLSLKDLIKKQGRLLLACPSKYHQAYLKQNNPQGLQPVDEDVDYWDIAKIAKDVDGEVIFFEYQKIWRTYDYFYAVIEKDPLYNSENSILSNKKIELELLDSRINRLENKLGYRLPKPKPKPPKSKNWRKLISKALRKMKIKL